MRWTVSRCIAVLPMPKSTGKEKMQSRYSKNPLLLLPVNTCYKARLMHSSSMKTNMWTPHSQTFLLSHKLFFFFAPFLSFKNSPALSSTLPWQQAMWGLRGTHHTPITLLARRVKDTNASFIGFPEFKGDICQT